MGKNGPIPPVMTKAVPPVRTKAPVATFWTKEAAMTLLATMGTGAPSKVGVVIPLAEPKLNLAVVMRAWLAVMKPLLGPRGPGEGVAEPAGRAADPVVSLERPMAKVGHP